MASNRFFMDGSSSSEESSDDEPQVQIQTKKGTGKTGAKAAPKPYLAMSDDEEDVKRVVRSEKEKRHEEMEEIIKKTKHAMRIRDIGLVYECYENLIKAFEKAKRILEKQGLPRSFIKILAQLDDFVNECWGDRAWRETLSKNNSNNLSALRQKIRRFLKQEPLESEINAYREKPDVAEEEVPEDEDAPVDEDDEDEEDEEEAAPVKGKPQDDDDSESSDVTWDQSDDESTDTSIDVDAPNEELYKKFLKTDKSGKDSKSKDTGASKRPSKPRRDRNVQRSEDEDDEGKETVSRQDVQKLVAFGKDEEITHDAILKKLNDIIAMRGKRGTNRRDQLECLKILRMYVEKQNLGVGIDIKILLVEIAVSFDYHHKGNDWLKPETWTRALDFIEELLELLKKNPDVQISENITEEAENLKKGPEYRIHGDVITTILKMDEEFTKILQNADAHSQDYVERLKDELRVCSIIDTLKTYLESKSNENIQITSESQSTTTISLVQPQHLCTAYMAVIEHLYYKHDKTPGQPSVPIMERLCKYIYAKDSLDRARARASLCHVYHLALHDHYYEARDLMLMCHMQDTITTSDVSTQILYNRTIVQLGLCAFRFGAIREAHQALVDMQSGNRAKELLAQGVQMSKNHERTREQEMKERQRLLPFHMHINLELIECVYLVSAMLIEVPFMASHEYGARKRPISKHFHTQMRQAEKQPVFGPPESMREHVVAASRAMKTGDWSACVNFLINEKMNSKVWNLMPQAVQVRKMLTDKIKEESLRTYLFTYATVYDAISMATLAAMFELDVKQVYGIISKMIINEELMASLEEPSQTVIMHHTDPSRTQALSLQLVEKIFQLYDQNEKLVQFRFGESGFYSRPNQQVQQGQQRNQGGASSGSGPNWNRNQRTGPNRAY